MMSINKNEVRNILGRTPNESEIKYASEMKKYINKNLVNNEIPKEVKDFIYSEECKTKGKRKIAEFLLDGIKEQIPEDWNVNIKEEPDVSLHLNKSGIFYQKIIRSRKTGDPIDIAKIPLWEWDSFKIINVLKNESTNKIRYDFEYNGIIYKEVELKEMKNIIAPLSLIRPKNKQLFGPLLHQYIKKYKIPIQIYSSMCGFTKDGWVLPNNYRIEAESDIRKQIVSGIDEMVNMDIDNKIAIKYMRDLYNASKVDNKDCIFAIGMILPFLYSLRAYTGLLPFFALFSPDSGTGKTTIATQITKKFWNNLNQDVLNADILKSPSKTGEFLSASNFGVVIDDCGELDDKSKADIKAYLTNETRFIRKDVNHKNKIDQVFCAPIVFTFNEKPTMFEDPSFLARGCIFPTDTKMTQKDKDIFKKIIEKIPSGYIGKFIYEKTKDWTIENLIKIYDVQENFTTDIKQNDIYKLVKIGAFLFRGFFGIKLNIEIIKEYIEATPDSGSDDVFGYIQTIIEEAHTSVRTNTKGEATSEYFAPISKWIKTVIVPHKYRKEQGHIFTSDNLSDLNLRRRNNRGRKDLSLPGLKGILSKRWLNISSVKSFTVYGVSYWGIFIPDNLEIKGMKKENE